VARALIPQGLRRGVALSVPASEQGAARAREADLAPALGAPLLQARSLGEVELSTAPLEVAHGLGRELAGWLFADPNVAAMVWRTGKDAQTLTLTASAPVRGTLWVW
jgi:hypothetical protein